MWVIFINKSNILTKKKRRELHVFLKDYPDQIQIDDQNTDGVDRVYQNPSSFTVL